MYELILVLKLYTKYVGLEKPFKVFPRGGNDNGSHVMISALCTSVLQALELLELQWQERFRMLKIEWKEWIQKE